MSQNEDLVNSLELFKWAASELPIRYYGDDALNAVCTPIELAEFGGDEVTQIASELIGTLTKYRAKTGMGRGLAANQIGYTRRIIVILLDDEPLVMCNPKLTSSEGQGSYMESCLSSGALLIGEVHRPWTGTFSYFTVDGAEQMLDADEKQTRILLHEIDHLHGITCSEKYEPKTMKIVTGGKKEVFGYELVKLSD